MKVLDKLKSYRNQAMVAVTGAVASVSAWADYNVTSLVAEFDKGEAPVAAMASASIELFIIRRIWRIIRSSI